MAVGSRGHRVLLEDGQGLGPRPGCSEVTAAAQPVSLSLHHVQQSCAERPQTTDSARCRGGPALVPANLCEIVPQLRPQRRAVLRLLCEVESGETACPLPECTPPQQRGAHPRPPGRGAPPCTLCRWPPASSPACLWVTPGAPPDTVTHPGGLGMTGTTATAATITSVTTTKAIFMTSKIVTTTTTVVIFITSNITTNTTIAIFMTSNFVTTTTTIITTITIIIFLTSNIFTTTTIPTFITSNITTNTTITIFTTTTTTATFITSNITTNTCITSNITTNTTFITSSIVTTIATTVTAFITSNIITTTFFTSNITTNTFSPPTSHQHLYQHHSLQNHLHHLIITTDTLSGPTCFITKMWVNVLGSGSPGKQRPYIPV
ncbi:unnamed protein product [Rangifer tarandus platyrhynchus]|uniref:Uncharacterized protein n=1 Tax=Rangifer tarandus platyrhynchus TaxID=3082113 RepID=A0ABN8ZHS0_RANTA|nr:unnamed protein product [Rangifer tarandus platyrhynchus]